MKKTTKKTNPAFEVDLTWCTTPTEIYAAFGMAKQRAGLPMKNFEFQAIVSQLLDIKATAAEAFDNICRALISIECKCEQKKPNVFKRFWNWITRKK